jgi:HlyD family secretion protein
VLARTGDIVVEVNETGTIQPVDRVAVRSKVAGRLLTLPVEEGQRVRAGQLIATVDRTLLDPQIAQIRAQLSQAKARLAQAEAAYRLQRVQSRMAIAQAQAGLNTAQARLASVAAGARPQELAQQEQAVRRAQVALDEALRTLARRQTLVAKGFISQAEADTAQTTVDTARSNLATAQQALSLTQAGPRVQDINDAKTQVDAARVQLASARANALQDDVRKADIAQARANLQQITGNLSQLQVQVADTRILAPASGIVLKKYRQPGEIVQSATTGFSDTQSLIVTLGSRLEVQVGVNEVDVGKVKKGAPVTVEVDAVPGARLAGVVTEIAPASTNAFSDSGAGSSGSGGQSSISKFSVKVGFRKYDPRLRPGMSAGVTILSARRTGTVLVPLEAVPFPENQGTVQVLDAAGKPQAKRVVLGLRNDTQAEVVHGLKSGDKVVVADPPGKRRTINVAGPN